MAFELQKTPADGFTQQRVTQLSGFITIGATGAIANQGSTSGQANGVVWSRNATGDYRGVIHRGYKRAIQGDAGVTAPAAATALVLTVGSQAQIQGITAANFMGTSPISTVAIATVRPDTGALADPTSGVTITYDLYLSDL